MDDLKIELNNPYRGHMVELMTDDDMVELYVAEGAQAHRDAVVTLDRSQATQIRDWLNEWLTGSEAVTEAPEPSPALALSERDRAELESYREWRQLNSREFYRWLHG